MARKNGTSLETGSETFPKIAAEATIKKVTMADKAGLTFDDLEFSPDQYAQLERWRKFGDRIRLTLEQIQGTLDQPDEDQLPLLDGADAEKKKAAETKPKPGRKKKAKGMEATVATTEEIK